jgi:hypothetical protein
VSEHPTNAPQGAKIDDGGQAFPGHWDHGGGQIESWTGMSLRAYFMAHAPAEPQTWFRPAVIANLPPRPVAVENMTEAEANEMRGWDDYIFTAELTQPRVREYALAHDAYTKAASLLAQETERQRYLQWPAAWADAQMAILKGQP